MAIDLAEEHTVKEVKVTYRPTGPNASWDLMKARAPAIPTLRSVDEDLNQQFRTIHRGTRHTDPAKEGDIQKLLDHYMRAKIHEYVPGRNVSGSAETVREFVSDGIQIANTKIVPKWVERRAVYEHSTEESWTTA